ncbi:hypothetical protein QAD02_011107 [Eretmocerus hayati]|uniref:Uncharacterized protein n=1 Tax=Eretmocerus hayati TaxID=131215 RepID=A0ACC2NVZ5_9HYME|nr:hypothetical protein QAD02_011107 [Eretmocerus hayati]
MLARSIIAGFLLELSQAERSTGTKGKESYGIFLREQTGGHDKNETVKSSGMVEDGIPPCPVTILLEELGNQWENPPISYGNDFDDFCEFLEDPQPCVRDDIFNNKARNN